MTFHHHGHNHNSSSLFQFICTKHFYMNICSTSGKLVPSVSMPCWTDQDTPISGHEKNMKSGMFYSKEKIIIITFSMP